MTVSRSWLERLPVRTSQRLGETFLAQHLVRCGVSVRVAGTTQRVLGHGSSTDLERALVSATWELRERVLMIAEVTGDPGRVVYGTELRRPDVRHEARFIDIVARPWHPTYRPGRDATGIAVHRSRSLAMTAAVAELVERMINARLWYDAQCVPLVPAPMVGSDEPLRGVYTRAWCGAVAGAGVAADFVYALCVVDDPAEQILVCGTAVREARHDAVAHARDEAIMVYESVARDLPTRYHAASSRTRFSSLRGCSYNDRTAHLASCLAAAGNGPAPDLDDVVVWDLVEGEDVQLVRATDGRDAQNLAWWRARRPHDVPDDPFV